MAGNSGSDSAAYTVLKWDLYGFYQPVDMGGVFNTVKGGSTVPLKFNVFAGTELTDTAAVKSLIYKPISCDTGTNGETPIEQIATGGTSLRYDWVEGQFVFNWKTPKQSGCFQAIMTTLDGSTLVANFKLK
jgi:hypothetical protein